jgi:hypothetical protein
MQISVANVGSSSTTITVTIAGTVRDTYSLAPSEARRIKYWPVNDGPVVVTSSGGVPILSSERTAYSPDGGVTWARFAEMIGVPDSMVEDSYLFPWYNNVDHSMDVSVGNVGNATTTVTVTIGGDVVDSYSLVANEATRQEYSGINTGPVEVTSSGNIPIVVSEGAKYSPDAGTTWTSYSELMGLPASLLHPTFAFPWYNSVHIDTLVLFAVP